MNQKLVEKIEGDCRAINLDAAYREMIDEAYDFEQVGGPFASMQPSKVLEEMDPIAFRCGFNDWTDGESRDRDYVTPDNGSNYYERSDCEKARDELLSDLETEKVEMEERRESLTATESEALHELEKAIQEIASEEFND